MTGLQILHAYWASNATLTGAVAANKVYTGVVPEDLVMPYVVITEISSVPEYNTCADYTEGYAFQLEVWAEQLLTAETLSETIRSQFDWQQISATTVSCLRTNRYVAAEEGGAYRVILEYLLTYQRTLPS